MKNEKLTASVYFLGASALIICALLIMKTEHYFTSITQAGTVSSVDGGTAFTAKIGHNDDGYFYIDNNTGFLMMLRYDIVTKKMVVLDSMDLKRLFVTAADRGTVKKPRKGGRIR